MVDSLLTAPAGSPAPDFSKMGSQLNINTPSADAAIAPVKSLFPTPIPQASAAPAPTQTMDAATIKQGQGSSVQFPTTSPTYSPSNAIAQNASIPTLADITSKETVQTPAEQQNQTFLQKVANLIGQGKGQTTLTNEAEDAAGVPALTKTVNDLNTQLQGLNDQATALQNAAQYTIPNQEQVNAEGRGITTAGLAPIQASDLRKNQIQQGAIATQSLTLKAALYGAQGNLSLAKDAADKAATSQYEEQQRQIDYQNALIAANKPQMTSEEQARSDLVTAQLADRQRQLDNAKADKSTIIAMATAAIKNNPNDPAAQYAAQQALAASNQQVPDLQAAFNLVGKYQDDPQALQTQLLDQQLKRAQIANTKANTTKTLDDKTQNALEQQYRNALLKEVSNRSGALGTQDAKVNQATHLAALFNQYKDSKGNFNIPAVQYAEIAMGLANLVSGSNQVSDSAREAILQRTAAGDMKGALTYITGVPQTGSTQAVFKNLADSIDRQGQVAAQLRDKYVGFLHGLAPTGLDQSRVDALDQNTLTPYVPITANSGSNTLMTGPDGKDYNVPNDKVDAFTKAGGKKK